MPARFITENYKTVADTIRGLSIDAIQKANSGHPGLPLGMADVAAVLWMKYMRYSSADPQWHNRDRFVLSGGHGSAMLYSLLHLAGFQISISDLENFRQFGSKTPGHPELGRTPGVETTTGPLGQGLANAVGMAIAEKMLEARFNAKGREIFNNAIYVFCGDGDMMEGVSHEAASIAGHLALDNLVVFYDSNKISIEGSTDTTFTDDTAKRFRACGWKTMAIDGHNHAQIDNAIKVARRTKGAPFLIVCKTTIGFGSPNKAGTAKSHGEPLGEAEVVLTKQALGIPADRTFHVPDKVRALFAKRLASNNRHIALWRKTQKAALANDADFRAKWDAHFSGKLPDTLAAALPQFDPAKPVSTRSAFGKIIQQIAKETPAFIGGSADLAPSNCSWLEGCEAITPKDFSGRNIRFGVREFAMAAIQNGMLAYGGFRPFVSTFYVFSDYLRPAVRIAAL
ncbi:MAG: transketolase, partial [Kiritimatiellaeota bacterium]|nr:transketolase [Kiritimatiellota bacterium]